MLSSTARGNYFVPACALALCGLGCGTGSDDGAPEPHVIVTEENTNVDIDPGAPLASVAPSAFGIHTSVYDNSLNNANVPALLKAAGITTLRYPGGGYSDNYHWSTHTLIPSYGVGRPGYLAQGTDFGSYISVLDRLGGSVVITVNYGSNPQGTAPGEPKEAAAWVAYANGAPDDPTLIGVDGSGNDWQTVGYWAGLRASRPLADDDGKNFLRIAHPEPVGVKYWEIGNEIFGNGYYGGGTGYEEDLHLAYDGTPREGHPNLAPAVYGSGVLDFISAMKAVDPTIKIGAVLNTPPMDYSWGPDWDREVLRVCASAIDFAIVHWYTGTSPANLLSAPTAQIPLMQSALRGMFEQYAPETAGKIEVFLTEMGANFTIPSELTQVMGLFAADGYVGLMEHGVANVDWLELHNGSFLSERNPRLGPAYKGIQMAHFLVSAGDVLVSAVSDSKHVVAHSAARADGSTGVMLVNTSDAITETVTVSIAGGALASEGTRYDYRPQGLGSDGPVTGPTAISGVGNAFTIVVPPYSVTDLIIPSVP